MPSLRRTSQSSLFTDEFEVGYIASFCYLQAQTDKGRVLAEVVSSGNDLLLAKLLSLADVDINTIYLSDNQNLLNLAFNGNRTASSNMMCAKQILTHASCDSRILLINQTGQSQFLKDVCYYGLVSFLTEVLSYPFVDLTRVNAAVLLISTITSEKSNEQIKRKVALLLAKCGPVDISQHLCFRLSARSSSPDHKDQDRQLWEVFLSFVKPDKRVTFDLDTLLYHLTRHTGMFIKLYELYVTFADDVTSNSTAKYGRRNLLDEAISYGRQDIVDYLLNSEVPTGFKFNRAARQSLISNTEREIKELQDKLNKQKLLSAQLLSAKLNS